MMIKNVNFRRKFKIADFFFIGYNIIFILAILALTYTLRDNNGSLKTHLSLIKIALTGSNILQHVSPAARHF